MAENDSTPPPKSFNLDSLISIDKSAQITQYLNYANRLRSGEKLTPGEFNQMQQLSKELMVELETTESQTPLSDNPIKPASVRSLRKAAEYLEKSGYAVKRSTVINHAKVGLIRRNSEGQYDTKDLDRYAMTNLKRLDGAPVTEEDKRLSKLQEEKLIASTKIITEQARYWENRNRDTDNEIKIGIERGVAARALIFKQHFETLFRSKPLDIIHLVSGDPVKAPELTDYLLTVLYSALAQYTDNREFIINADGCVA
jgi:hypothetical protein